MLVSPMKGDWFSAHKCSYLHLAYHMLHLTLKFSSFHNELETNIFVMVFFFLFLLKSSISLAMNAKGQRNPITL